MQSRRTNHSGFLATIVAALSLMVVACQSAADEPVSVAAAETLTRDMETQTARAVKDSPSRVHVDIVSRAGAALFSVDIKPGSSGEETVAWSRQPDASQGAGGAVTQGSLPVPLDELPSLEDSIKIASFVQARVTAGMSGQDYDNWGCDLPFTNVSSCSRKGKCCDVHDSCYARNRCSASSWVNPLAPAACKRCNAAVVACIGNPASLPGKSSCCARGNCGRPR